MSLRDRLDSCLDDDVGPIEGRQFPTPAFIETIFFLAGLRGLVDADLPVLALLANLVRKLEARLLHECPVTQRTMVIIRQAVTVQSHCHAERSCR